MVDKDGKLIQNKVGNVQPSPAPRVVIRKGLDIDKIMMHLSDTFNSWDYRQGVSITKIKNELSVGGIFPLYTRLLLNF